MKGKVLATDGARMRVAVDRPAACAGCGLLRSCGMDGGGGHAVSLPARPDLKRGAPVDLDLPAACGLRFALWAYGLPLSAWVAGVIGGAALGPRIGLPRDPVGLACGLVALGAAFLVLHRADPGFRRRLEREIVLNGEAAGTIEPRSAVEPEKLEVDPWRCR